MSNLCYICGKRMSAKICTCGFDESKNYEKYRTLSRIPEKAASLKQLSVEYKAKFDREKSIHTDTNDELAFDHMLALAQAGFSYWQYKIGECYSTGNGVEKNPAKAYEWYLKAAKQGDPTAKSIIDSQYKVTETIERNVNEEAKTLRDEQDNQNDFQKTMVNESVERKHTDNQPQPLKQQKQVNNLAHRIYMGIWSIAVFSIVMFVLLLYAGAIILHMESLSDLPLAQYLYFYLLFKPKWYKWVLRIVYIIILYCGARFYIKLWRRLLADAQNAKDNAARRGSTK